MFERKNMKSSDKYFNKSVVELLSEYNHLVATCERIACNS